MVAGLAAGARGEERPRNIDHVPRLPALIEERRAAVGTKAARRFGLGVLEARDTFSAQRDARVLSPASDVSGIGGAVRAGDRARPRRREKRSPLRPHRKGIARARAGAIALAPRLLCALATSCSTLLRSGFDRNFPTNTAGTQPRTAATMTERSRGPRLPPAVTLRGRAGRLPAPVRIGGAGGCCCGWRRSEGRLPPAPRETATPPPCRRISRACPRRASGQAVRAAGPSRTPRRSFSIPPIRARAAPARTRSNGYRPRGRPRTARAA